ncbi:helix-turn-helix transcriptional regulator [Cyanobacteria bacterium FACHB-472]|nr:helix-turn-helix transcriptional regulator [Cyanobacteria bacterium FACHB-472]
MPNFLAQIKQLDTSSPPAPDTRLEPRQARREKALREARTKMKWSMGQLAKYSGVDKSVISRIEQGKRNATPETMTKLRQALESGS